MNETKKNEPEERIRIGRIEAALWKNAGDNGDWYSVTLTRSYEGAGGKWRSTSSFSGADLIVAAEVLRLAHQRTRELQSE